MSEGGARRRSPAETGITVKIQPQGDAGQLTNKLVLTKGSPAGRRRLRHRQRLRHPRGRRGRARRTPVRSTSRRRRSRSRSRARRASSSARSTTATCASTSTTPGSRSGEADPAEDPRRPDRPALQGALRHPRRDHLLARPGLPARHDRRQGRRAGRTTGRSSPPTTSRSSRAGRTPTRSTSPPAAARATGRSSRRTPPRRRSPCPRAAPKPTTSALLDTCFRQVEYAGVLDGAKNPDGHGEVHRVHARPGVPGRPARQHVRLPGRQHRRAAGGVGEVRHPVARSRTPSTPTRSPRTARRGCASGATSPAGEPTSIEPRCAG